MLDGALRQRCDKTLKAVREPAHDGVRERHRALEPRGADELDRVVDDGVLRLVGERELVGAEPQRGADGWVELAHRPLAELLDAEVERPRHLHRPVGEALREGAVARVEAGDGRRERAIGVVLLFEDAPHHLIRRRARWRDQRRPRTNSS